MNGALTPVYRHTKLTSADQVQHSFLNPNDVKATSPANPRVIITNTGLMS